MLQVVQEALDFAARAHDGQKRKVSGLPYIVHPVGAMMCLVEYGENDPEILAAALLHDVVEDTSVTLDEIREMFGERVARIVDGCSEPDKSDTWENRKAHTIQHLRTASKEVALVTAADKLHNVLSMTADSKRLGEQMWDGFKRGPRENAQYYRAVVRGLSRVLGSHAILAALDKAVEELFRGRKDLESGIAVSIPTSV